MNAKSKNFAFEQMLSAGMQLFFVQFVFFGQLFSVFFSESFFFDLWLFFGFQLVFYHLPFFGQRLFFGA